MTKLKYQSLPAPVTEVLLNLERLKDGHSEPEYKEKYKLLKKLTVSLEHIKMWHSFYNHARNPDDDCCLWVWGILNSIHTAYTREPYYYKNKKERESIKNKLCSARKNLLQTCKSNQLERTLISLNNKIWNGFYFIENFSTSNQERIRNDEELLKLAFTDLLNTVIDEFIQQIDDSKIKGHNKKSIRFVRELGRSTLFWFSTPLNEQIALISNSILETNYNSSQITELLNQEHSENELKEVPISE